MFKAKTVVVSVVAFAAGVATALFFSRGAGDLQAAAALKPEIIFYSQPNFQGREVHLYGDAVDLPYEDLADGTQMLWNDNVGSLIVVSGTWRLYQHGRMNTALDDTPLELLDLGSKVQIGGWSSLVSGTTAGPLKIASVEHLGVGPDISSVQLVSSLNLPDWVYGRS
ncbi:MAG: beta/gamma crystallin family protein [Planctomycetes bacterium]|nr:beta/gamma crystallin family protein [Planctomycetota bacterium]